MRYPILAEATRAEPRQPRTEHEAYLVAYLAGGPERALLAALGTLRLAGLVRVARKRLVRVGDPVRIGRPELERAVLAETAEPVSLCQLAKRGTVRTALDELRGGLVRRGLWQAPAARSVFAAVVGRRRPTERTAAGALELDRLRTEFGLANAEGVPNWDDPGPRVPALDFGLFGLPALAQLNPAFARYLADAGFGHPLPGWPSPRGAELSRAHGMR